MQLLEFLAIARFLSCVPQEGLASAMETICGQSYGAEDYLAIGDVSQRVYLILTSFCVPLAFILLFTKEILTYLGQASGYSALIVFGLLT